MVNKLFLRPYFWGGYVARGGSHWLGVEVNKVSKYQGHKSEKSKRTGLWLCLQDLHGCTVDG